MAERKKSVWFDNMAVAEVMTGIPRSVQRRFKAEGCEAFRGGKIHGPDLLAYSKKDAEKKSTDDSTYVGSGSFNKKGSKILTDEEREQKFKADILEEKLKKIRGDSIDKTDAERVLLAALMPIKQMILGLASRVSHRLEGLNNEQRMRVLNEESNEILSAVKLARIDTASALPCDDESGADDGKAV